MEGGIRAALPVPNYRGRPSRGGAGMSLRCIHDEVADAAGGEVKMLSQPSSLLQKPSE